MTIFVFGISGSGSCSGSGSGCGGGVSGNMETKMFSLEPDPLYDTLFPVICQEIS